MKNELNENYLNALKSSHKNTQKANKQTNFESKETWQKKRTLWIIVYQFPPLEWENLYG